MTVIQIIQLILALAPSGVTITQDILNIISAIEQAINGTPGTPEHAAALQVLTAFTSKTTA